MGVELLDPHSLQRSKYLGVKLRRWLHELSCAGALAGLAHEAPVLATFLQQGTPGLGCTLDGHGLR